MTDPRQVTPCAQHEDDCNCAPVDGVHFYAEPWEYVTRGCLGDHGVHGCDCYYLRCQLCGRSADDGQDAGEHIDNCHDWCDECQVAYDGAECPRCRWESA